MCLAFKQKSRMGEEQKTTPLSFHHVLRANALTLVESIPMKCVNNSERWCLLSIYIFPALCCVYHMHCGFYSFPRFPDELKHGRWFGHVPKLMWSLCCLTRIRIWWSHSPCQPLLPSTSPLRPLPCRSLPAALLRLPLRWLAPCHCSRFRGKALPQGGSP